MCVRITTKTYKSTGCCIEYTNTVLRMGLEKLGFLQISREADAAGPKVFAMSAESRTRHRERCLAQQGNTGHPKLLQGVFGVRELWAFKSLAVSDSDSIKILRGKTGGHSRISR